MIAVEFEADTPLLRATREAVPELTLTVEAEQAPAPDPEPIHLQFTATGEEFEALEAALAADPTVERPRLLGDAGDHRLYRVVYTEAGMAATAHREWVRLDGRLRGATATDDGWVVRMLFPDGRAVTALKEWFDERGFAFEVTGLVTDDWRDAVGPGRTLTEGQREALLAAWRRGYFDVPKGIDLAGLADELEVSDTAVSQRLRRGITALLADSFERTSEGDA